VCACVCNTNDKIIYLGIMPKKLVIGCKVGSESPYFFSLLRDVGIVEEDDSNALFRCPSTVVAKEVSNVDGLDNFLVMI